MSDNQYIPVTELQAVALAILLLQEINETGRLASSGAYNLPAVILALRQLKLKLKQAEKEAATCDAITSSV